MSNMHLALIFFLFFGHVRSSAQIALALEFLDLL